MQKKKQKTLISRKETKGSQLGEETRDGKFKREIRGGMMWNGGKRDKMIYNLYM